MIPMVNFKKFISIVMVVCLVVSMSTMAFAAKTSLSKENTVVVHNEDGDLLVSYDPHMYVDAKDAVAMTNSVDGKEVAYGKTVYIPLVDESGSVVSTSSAVSALLAASAAAFCASAASFTALSLVSVTLPGAVMTASPSVALTLSMDRSPSASFT